MQYNVKGEISKMTIVSLIVLIGIGILCAFIHRNKGYSAITGFCWGFFFSILGVIIVLLERNKEEQIVEDKGNLSMTKWIFIFLGLGALLMVIFFIMMTLKLYMS